MKKLIFITFLFLSILSYGQYTTSITDSVIIFHHPYDDVVVRFDTIRPFFTNNPFTTGKAIRYFASNGNSENTGLTEASPLPIDSINTLDVISGTIMGIVRGTEWRGELTARDSLKYVIVGSSGNIPILNGANLIEDATFYSGNVYKKVIDFTPTTMFDNDIYMQNSRYPEVNEVYENNYFFIDAVVNDSTIVCSDLKGIDLTDSWITVRAVGWAFESREFVRKINDSTIVVDIAGHSAGDIYGLSSGDPFYAINVTSQVDKANEWSFDVSESTVYFVTNNSSNPSLHKIEASKYGNGITGTNINYFTVKGITIKNYQSNAIEFTGIANDVNIANCNLLNNYESSIYSSVENNNVDISNNVIEGSNRQGIYLFGGKLNTIEDNTISDISLFENLNIYANIESVDAANGILIRDMDSSYVQYNELNNIGYNGIRLMDVNTSDNYIQYNRIDSAVQTLKDGGGIYIAREHTRAMITGNVISNSGISGDAGSHGIYFDDTASRMTISGNIIWGCNGNGIFLHNAHNIDVEQNTVFNTIEHSVLLRHNTEASQMDSITLTSNLLVNTTIYEKTLWLYYYAWDDSTVAVISNNIHGNEWQDCISIPSDFGASITQLNAYLGYTSGDAYATVSNWTNDISLLYNATKLPVVQDIGGYTIVTDVATGDTITSLTLQPFTAKIIEGR